jgi:ADP-ribose pyrophosphatase YjhB (NUDIX family)
MFNDFMNLAVRWFYRGAYVALRGWWLLRRPQTHGACVALWHQGKTLIVRTSYRRRYSFPGGFVGRGESSEHAARRELREELTIDLSGLPLRHAWHGTLPFECRRDTVDIWEASVDEAPEFHVNGREILWAAWIEPSEALALPLVPHVAAYLQSSPRRAEAGAIL